MNNNIERFIESIESLNTARVAEHILKDVECDIEHLSIIELEDLILELKPNSQKKITTICYVLGMYGKWAKEQGLVADDSLYQMIQSLDKKLIWKKAKPNARKKFISNEQFEQIIHDIGVYEDFNGLYYQSLFRCIYEGIYNEDLSVIKNLRSSDIENNIITLHEDNGHSYKLKISETLVSELKELADINYWERKNSYNTFKVPTKGIHNDSVFKIEERDTGSNGTYNYSYYSKLRKIAKEYVEYTLPPFQLYVSGIMHRVKVELNKKNILLEEAFSENNHNSMVNSIISNELIRCNYDTNIGNFKLMVKGHLDSF